MDMDNSDRRQKLGKSSEDRERVPKFEWIHESVSKTEPDTRCCGFSRGLAGTKGPAVTYIHCFSTRPYSILHPLVCYVLLSYIALYHHARLYIQFSIQYLLVLSDAWAETPTRTRFDCLAPSIYQKHPCCVQQLGNRTRSILPVNALS